jgi:hypothetical protein
MLPYDPPPRPDITITLTFLVVGEEGIEMSPSEVVCHGVYLKRNAMEWVKRVVSRSHFWGSGKKGREKKSGFWSATVWFRDRTHNFFDGNPQIRYGGPGFDSVVICYDPRSPRKSFELVWTKVCPGLLRHHKCSEMIGHSDILGGGYHAQWLPEIGHFLPGTPIVLIEVGGGREEDWVISSEEGIRVAEGLGASFIRWPLQEADLPIVTGLVKAAFKHQLERNVLKTKRR